MDVREAVDLLTPFRVLHLVAAALCAQVPCNPQIDGATGTNAAFQERRALACLHLLHVARAGPAENFDWRLSSPDTYFPARSVLDRLPSAEREELQHFADRWVELTRHVLSESVDVLYDAFEVLLGDLFVSVPLSLGDVVLGSLQVDESFQSHEQSDTFERGIGTDRVLQRSAFAGGSALGTFVRRCRVAFESLPFEAVAQLHREVTLDHTKAPSTHYANVVHTSFDFSAVRRAAHRAVRAIVIAGGPPHPRDRALLKASTDPAAELFRWVDAVWRRNLNEANFALRRYNDLAIARCNRGMFDSGPQEAAVAVAGMLVLMGHPVQARIALEESIRVAQQTGDHVTLSRALTWISRLTENERKRLRYLKDCWTRSPKLSQESVLARLAAAHTLLNMNFPLGNHTATKFRKWRRILRHMECAYAASVNSPEDTHLVLASMHTLAVLSGQPLVLRESLTEMRLRSLLPNIREFTEDGDHRTHDETTSSLSSVDHDSCESNAKKAGAGANFGEHERSRHPLGELPVQLHQSASIDDGPEDAAHVDANFLLTSKELGLAPTEHLARALCAASAETLMRHGILRASWTAALPLRNACALVRAADDEPESSPVLRILHQCLARIAFEYAVAREEWQIAAACLERLTSFAPPIVQEKYPDLAGNSASTATLNAILDVLDCHARFWLCRAQVSEALYFAEEFAQTANKYAALGCRSRLVDALLLQVECYLSAEMNARALAASLASISLAESIGDEPRRFRGILSLAQVRLAMQAVDYASRLLESADSMLLDQKDSASLGSAALWKSLVSEESCLSHSDRARVWMMLGGIALVKMQSQQSVNTGEATSCFEMAFRTADLVALQREALFALLHTRGAKTDIAAMTNFEFKMQCVRRQQSSWAEALQVSGSTEWEQNVCCYLQHTRTEFHESRNSESDLYMEVAAANRKSEC